MRGISSTMSFSAAPVRMSETALCCFIPTVIVWRCLSLVLLSTSSPNQTTTLFMWFASNSQLSPVLLIHSASIHTFQQRYTLRTSQINVKLFIQIGSSHTMHGGTWTRTELGQEQSWWVGVRRASFICKMFCKIKKIYFIYHPTYRSRHLIGNNESKYSYRLLRQRKKENGAIQVS